MPLPLGRLFLLAFLLVLAWARAADAHALGVSLKTHQDRVHITAFFDDGAAATEAVVVVRNAKNETIATGKTDANGVWSFAAPADGEYQVTVDAGGEHRATRPLRLGPLTRPSATDPDAAVDQGDDREEFTRFPWLKLAIGVGTIAVMSLALLLARRHARHTSKDSRAASERG